MYTTLIDAQTLEPHLDSPHWVMVDCRFDLMQPAAGYQAYLAGHLPGAVYADLNTDLSGPLTAISGRHPLPDPAHFAQCLGHWGIDNASQVVVYDASNGAYAVRLWWMLRWLGHPSVAVLNGGLAAWVEAELPLTTSIPQPIPAYFEVHLQAENQLSQAQLRQGLREGAISVVDARAGARYAGEVEPIDPVAGHVPGALNYPYEVNLEADGRFCDVETLKRRFAAFAQQPDQVVHMCGSGVTACHNLLAMEIAGLSGSKLYAGSWSEWVRDPKNPVAIGYDA